MNEFHARICQAQIQTNTIMSAQTNVPYLCSLLKGQPFGGCVSFIDYAKCYYNQDGAAGMFGGPNYLPLIILAGLLALMWLLILLLCCCCLCCPWLCASCCSCCCGLPCCRRFCSCFRNKSVNFYNLFSSLFLLSLLNYVVY